MATTTKQWSNGDLVTLTYSGEGNGSVSVASSPNESIDRSMTINIATTKGSPEVTKLVTINQAGLRETFFLFNRHHSQALTFL